MSVFALPKADYASWSKSGLIAYADSESTYSNLCITFMETVNGTNWRLHPSRKYMIHPHLLEAQSPGSAASLGTNTSSSNQRFFHNLRSIFWNNSASHSGEQLAVCDEIGNVTVMAAGQTSEGPSTLDNIVILFQDNVYKIQNQMATLQTASPTSKISRKHAKKESHTSVIEFMWIGTQKPSFAILGARKEPSTSTFKSQVQQCPPYGLYHPTSIKSACIALRRDGQLDFWYQFSNSKEHKKITLQLSSFQQSQGKQFEWFQIGKFAQMEDEQTLLVGAFSKLSRKISFYKILVNWNTSAQNAVGDPSVQLQHLMEMNPDYLGPHGERITLTDFALLSPTHDKSSRVELVICYKLAGVSRSLVKRYELVKSTPSPQLTSAFGVLNVDSSPSAYEYSFTEKEGIEFDSAILSVERYTSEMLIAFRLRNGETKIYDRTTWKPEQVVAADGGSSIQHKDLITSPFSTGIKMSTPFPLYATEWSIISPGLGGILSKLKSQDDLRFDPITAAVTENADEDIAIAIAFAYAFVCANHQQISAEDLSIAIKTHLLFIKQRSEARAEAFLKQVISNVYHMFGLTSDASKELKDKLIMSRPIQRAMLLQLELGGTFENSNVYNMSRTAMSLRNILFAFNGVSRNIQVLIHHGATMNLQQPSGKLFQFAFSKQDLIYSLIPCAKWFVKLVTFLTQQMIVLINKPEDQENTLVLGILSSKMTRQLLLSVLSEIRKIIHLVTKFPETTFPILNESSIYLRKVLSDSPVNFEKFETFLADVNYKFTSLSEQQTPGSTIKDSYLIIDGDIPEQVSHLKDFLLSYSNTAVISHIKPAEVYFSDTRGLRIFASELFSDQVFRPLQPLEKGLVIGKDKLPESTSSTSFCVFESDDISKEAISAPNEKQKSKRCCRCGAVTRAGYTVSKDNTIVPTSITTKRWTSLYSKICICSGFLYEL